MTANLHKSLSTSDKISYFCCMKKKIHVISFQNPYPPNYGGVIDVYYKLKALKESDFHITLHTYNYGNRTADYENLSQIADVVHLYKRETGITKQLSSLPYIVNSRRDNSLIANLLNDDAPILFEGLHTCYFLSDIRLKNRLKIVRTHNVEHDYYHGLYLSAKKLKDKLFYALEAKRLKCYEKVLTNADYIMAISETDRDYFTNKYSKVIVKHLPCFFDDEISSDNIITEKFVLYHGNLSVGENITAAKWIIDKIAPNLPDITFKFAGSTPPEHLTQTQYEHKNVEFIVNPDDKTLNQLVRHAHINLLITFQATGIKLKLLKALTKGAFVIANSQMVEGSGLSENCIVANSPQEIINNISDLMSQTYTPEQKNLRHLPSNAASIKTLTSIIH